MTSVATPDARNGVEAVHPLTSFARGWNRFWFNPSDPTVLGLVRICCGLMTLYVHLAYTCDLQAFFGRNAWLSLETANEFRKEVPWVAPASTWEEPSALPLPPDPDEREQVVHAMQRWGIDPRLATAEGNRYASLWFHVTDPLWMGVVHCGILAVMFLFTIGYCTRITSVLTWLAALSYIQRSQVTVFGMDTMMNVILLYLMIGPSGAALSVDALLRRRQAAWAGEPYEPRPLVSANFALRLLQVHLCIIYLAAGLSKLQGVVWWNGTALWGTLANYEFTPLRFALYAGWLRWLCTHRWIWELVMTGGTMYTLALEIAFPFLIWQRPTRCLMITGAVLLHTGIALTMGLVGFGLFMFALLVSFIPAEAVRELMNHAGRLVPLGSRRTTTAEQGSEKRIGALSEAA
jgi:Vitamin K-dependent gamma-carboxylase